MKILLLITFYLISGPVGCVDVPGYKGGRVKIYCIPQTAVYFCKFKTQTKCEYLIEAQEQNKWINKDRFSLYHSTGSLTLIFRNLSLQDAGMYRCGETRAMTWSRDINLKVNSDPCCSGTRTVTGYLGQTVTIRCSYPVEFEKNSKHFYKRTGDYEHEVIYTNGREQYQDGRFSISDDRRNKVFSVNISDVREDDGGVYFCTVWKTEESVGYYSFFTKVHLHVTDDTDRPQTGFSFIITVCASVTLLLLIGGSVLVYKLKKRKTRDSASISQRTEGSHTTAADYENNLPQLSNITMPPIYQNLTSNTDQSDSAYQSLNPNTNQSDSAYQSLNPNTNQSDSAYQSLNPNTNQSNSAYQSLNPNTN
ncbi:uncharacterized protein LOC113526395 isoform X1 [Pangasianodon hypophthalmus]|uniref:uncharacterized protein LOC113526395 isoform X1 n=1 Tax=Pangasianodon hypophthalmus TaxID=310915 RepID=UPI0023072CBE|nr:uncharacterized protein LOC113526395 isoform X1 [Pangasianodon hypophthalmus]XP_053085801.1 uncharacterized protein LOC113526395 isoform X1 [Pangasianodon hypophthalmus]